jgi:hypothetical protein
VTKTERAVADVLLTPPQPKEDTASERLQPSKASRSATQHTLFAVTLAATGEYAIHDLRHVLKVARRRHLRCIGVREVKP